MAKSKVLQAVVEIAGNISPTLQESIKSATGHIDKLNVKALAVGAAVGTAAVATGKAVAEAGKYLYELGKEFDEAEDAIRIGTGAVGEDLDELMNSFNDVYSSIPASMEDASKAIADYNTRLGLTGDTLEELSAQAIATADMLGEDLTGVIESSSEAIKNWNIDEAYMADAMDYMFKVSQSTGIGFTELSSEMQSYGAQLQEVGYSFKDASILLGNVKKSGYDATAIMTALKTSAKKAASDGFLNINEGIESYIDQVKNASSETEAYSLATEYFGSKAAATMIQAIQSGTLELDSFKTALDESDESIQGCYEDTFDLTEWLTIMKNKLKVALQPMASNIFGQISDMMPTLIDMLDKFLPAVMNAVQEALPFVSEFLGGIADLLPTILPFIVQFGNTLLPILVELLQNLLPPLMECLQTIIPPLMEILTTILPPIIDLISQILPIITEIVAAILPVLIDMIQDLLPVIKPILDILLKLLKEIVLPLLEPLLMLISAVLEPLNPLLQALRPILEVIGKVLQPIAEVIGWIIEAIAKVVDWVSSGLTWVISLLFDDDDGASAAASKVNAYAKGGFATSPSICGEEGPEAVISFDPRYRQRNINILEQAAAMLGMSQTPDSFGGNALEETEDSYTAQAGRLLSLDDYSLSEHSGKVVNYYYDFSGFTWAPKFGGEEKEESVDFMSALEAHEQEFFEWLQAFTRAREVSCFG